MTNTKGAAPTNPAAATTPKVTASADVVKADKKVDLDKAAEAPVHADAGDGANVSAEEQKIIDAALGDHSESDDDDDDAPKPAVTRERAETALRQFRKVAKGIPATTPDDHPLWGNAEGSIKVGDLRALLSALPQND